ncbi:molybdopterin converting factor subunit 1 [Robiginitalea sp. IMCC43444]|uniref:molybdopterin converting factor subunit 1 n=1 Tax=Robiginitalea sp. IMCC43444 TaxID=3459121 RepID=UPI004042CA54
MKILLFGITRDIIGDGSLMLAEEDSKGLSTVGELKAQLKKEYPELDDLSSLAVAVNQQYATDEESINGSDEIALIPPVSGG